MGAGGGGERRGRVCLARTLTRRTPPPSPGCNVRHANSQEGACHVHAKMETAHCRSENEGANPGMTDCGGHQQGRGNTPLSRPGTQSSYTQRCRVPVTLSTPRVAYLQCGLIQSPGLPFFFLQLIQNRSA
jgi:hypothetical protein